MTSDYFTDLDSVDDIDIGATVPSTRPPGGAAAGAQAGANAGAQATPYLPPQRAIIIKVKNVPQLVAKMGGSMGSLVQSLAPESIDSKVYDEMSKKMKEGLEAQGADADVRVVDIANMRFASENPIWKPVALGIVGTGLVAGLYKLVMHFKGKR